MSRKNERWSISRIFFISTTLIICAAMAVPYFSSDHWSKDPQHPLWVFNPKTRTCIQHPLSFPGLLAWQEKTRDPCTRQRLPGNSLLLICTRKVQVLAPFYESCVKGAFYWQHFQRFPATYLQSWREWAMALWPFQEELS